jgi:hypothetical protein
VIRVGYKKTDDTNVTHQVYDNVSEANEAVLQLRDSKSSDASIKYFYLENQTTETDWERYGYIDPA